MKKTVGHVELEWTCPNCQGRNPGRVTVCANCGAPQPPNVEFHQAAEEKLITDEATIQRAEAGPDIHCPYCGARNPAGSKTCSQCSGDLSEGKARESGKVLGAQRTAPAPDVKCPACGVMNPAKALKCSSCGATLTAAAPTPTAAPAGPACGVSSGILIGLGVAVLLLIVALFVLLGRTNDVVGRVNNVQWERRIAILGYATAQHQAWRDEVPAQGEIKSCRQAERSRSNQPQPNSTEVCGTPYTVDEGSGYGKVVQDCQYIVRADLCTYTIQELQVVDTVVDRGNDLLPEWPTLQLRSKQQAGERTESFVVTFSVDGKEYTYRPNNAAAFAQFAPGSRWTLQINGLGDITDLKLAGP